MLLFTKGGVICAICVSFSKKPLNEMDDILTQMTYTIMVDGLMKETFLLKTSFEICLKFKHEQIKILEV